MAILRETEAMMGGRPVKSSTPGASQNTMDVIKPGKGLRRMFNKIEGLHPQA